MKNKIGFILTKLLLCLLLIVTSFNYALKAEEPSDDSIDSSEEHANGYIESELDRGLDAYYPEIVTFADETLESKYPNTDNPIQTIKDNYPASRNQGNFGTCWAFASIGLVEFDLVKNHGYTKDIDLSEFQLIYNTFYSVTDPFGNTVGDSSSYINSETDTYLMHGGDFTYTMSRLAQWISPINESLATYPDSTDRYSVPNALSDSLAYTSSPFHLENVYLVNMTTNADDVKKMIKEFGAVGTSYYDDSTYYKWDDNGNYTYYENAYSQVNHAIMIVGWDDNYSASNFKQGTPSKDGAWLVRNSWGDYRDYFWLSYETKSIQNMTAYAYDAVVDNYKYNYQLDGGLFSGSTSSSNVANTFKVQNKNDGEYDKLKAVNISLTNETNVSFSIDIYTELTDTSNPTSGTLHENVASGVTTYQGIYTIDLEDENVYLKPNTYYSIVVNFEKDVNVDTEYAYTNVSSWPMDVVANNYSFTYNEYYGWSTLDAYSFTDGKFANFRLKGFANDAYTLIFNANGGTVSESTRILEDGSSYGTLPTPTNSDSSYEFVGWYTSPTGGSKVDTTTTISDNTTIYAQWTKEEIVKVTFDANGGSLAEGVSNTNTYKANEKYDTLPTPTRTGYTFAGWYTAKDGGTKVTSETSVGDIDVTIYAHWTINQYTLTYDVGDGSLDNGQATSITLDYGSKYGTLPNVTPKAGYNFVGWFSEKEDGSQVTADTTIGASNTTIYAQYKEIVYNPYTLTFDGNGGTPSETSRIVKEGSAIGSLPSASKTGYTFTGWYKEDGTSVLDTTIMPSSDLTIYAHWNVNSYTLKFVSDDNTIKETNVEYNAQLGDLPTPDAKLGYEFVGWFDNDTQYTSGSTMPANDLTLIAKWKALDKPTITFNGNGGTSSEDGGQVNFDGTLVGTLPLATRTGYTFTGWFTESDGGTKLENNSNFSGISEIYAHWTINSYTISFNSDGGSDVSPISVEYGSTYLDKLPTPTKSKYKFLGWYTSDGSKVTDTDTMGASDITLNAHWEYVPQAYTLTLNYNDDTSKVETRSVMENTAYGDLPSLTRAGYLFVGWFNSQTGGEEVSANTLMDVKDVTIYAHWLKVRTITLNANIEGVDNSTINLDEDTNKFIDTLPTLTKDKYTFDGWFTKADGGEKVDNNSTLASGVNELFAHWTKNPGEVEIIKSETVKATEELKPTLDIANKDTTVNNLLTNKQKELKQSGDDADVYLTVIEGNNANDIEKAKAELGDNIFGQALDITLNIKVGDEVSIINDSKDEVSIKVNIPSSLKNNNSSKERTYFIIRVHNGKAEYLTPTYDKSNNTLTFKSRYFSTYIIAYKDTDKPTSNNTSSDSTYKSLSCEDYMKSRDWTWSEKEGKCVYKVRNTSSK